MHPLLRLVEALLVEARRLENRYPPTFVVGAPRSGTTLVGLHLASVFRWAYLPNVAKQNRTTPYLSTRLALRRGARWQPERGSRYGQAEGELAPSDGWDVLLRWFEGYREATAAHARAARPLKTLVRRLEDLFGAPFLCKNNQNTMRIGALAALFPDALFVLVRRALPETAASLLEARARHGVALGAWWSAAPPQYLGRAFADELEQVVATVWGLERYAQEQLERAAPERHLTLDYESFCARPDQLVDWVAAAYAARGVRLQRLPGEVPRSFEPSRLPPERRAALEARLAPLLARLQSEPDPTAGLHGPCTARTPGAPGGR